MKTRLTIYILVLCCFLCISGCIGTVWVKDEVATLNYPENRNYGERITRRTCAQAPLEIIFVDYDNGRLRKERQRESRKFYLRQINKNRYIATVENYGNYEIIAMQISKYQHAVRSAERGAWVVYSLE